MKPVFRFYCFLLCCCFCVFADAAQYKVVERSAKHAPEWVGQAIPGYLIFSAESATLDMAQQICMENIKNEIVNAIAANITATTTSFSEQTGTNGEFAITEGFRSDLKTIAARLPFVSGITIANVEDSYWEKRYDSKQKKYSYLVFLKYPFSRMERNRLIAEFQQYDAEKYKTLTDIKMQADNLTNVDDIARYLSDIEPLITYFFDETRKAEAESLQKSLRQIYKNIAVVPLSNELGKYSYALMYNGRKLSASRLPLARSEYASDISVVHQSDTTYVVIYNYDGCLPEDENTVDLVFNFGGYTNRHKFNFDMAASLLDVLPQGQVVFTVYGQEQGMVADSVMVSFDLRAKYDTKFSIKSLVISTSEFPQVEFPTCNDMADLGKGLQHIKLTAYHVNYRQNAKKALTDGYMKIENQKNGKIQTINIRLPYKINHY